MGHTQMVILQREKMVRPIHEAGLSYHGTGHIGHGYSIERDWNLRIVHSHLRLRRHGVLLRRRGGGLELMRKRTVERKHLGTT